MGEKIGFLFGLLLFAVLIVPFGGNMWLFNFESDQFMKTIGEVQKKVAEEGGVTTAILETTERLNKKGYSIRYRNPGGEVITSKQPPGTKIVIDYTYQFKNFYGQTDELKSRNQVIVSRRGG